MTLADRLRAERTAAAQLAPRSILDVFLSEMLYRLLEQEGQADLLACETRGDLLMIEEAVVYGYDLAEDLGFIAERGQQPGTERYLTLFVVPPYGMPPDVAEIYMQLRIDGMPSLGRWRLRGRSDLAPRAARRRAGLRGTRCSPGCPPASGSDHGTEGS